MKPIEILLVEDNPGDARLTTDAFKEGRIINNMHVVKDGQEAMDYLNHQGAHAGSVRPDIVLLDLNLPKKSGLEVLKEIKADPQLKTIPVVILTTSASDKDILSAYENYVNCYIRKPVDFNDFLVVVTKIEDFWLSIVKLPGM